MQYLKRSSHRSLRFFFGGRGVTGDPTPSKNMGGHGDLPPKNSGGGVTGDAAHYPKSFCRTKIVLCCGFGQHNLCAFTCCSCVLRAKVHRAVHKLSHARTSNPVLSMSVASRMSVAFFSNAMSGSVTISVQRQRDIGFAKRR